MPLLEIEQLHVQVAEKSILTGINLTVNAGEIHAIMGPNGSGKSTLVNLLAGRDGYSITSGQIHYRDHDLTSLSPDQRALAGIFLGFQYPVEIPGVNNMYLLKAALNAKRKAAGQAELDAIDFLELAKQKMKLLNMSEDFLYRDINAGFSGGEKKRNEILQMLMLEPTLILLDETDSGLDIDALKIVATGINSMRNSDRAVVLVTHYQRLLDYVQPDKVHVLAHGKIVRSGDASLAYELESGGYETIITQGLEN